MRRVTQKVKTNPVLAPVLIPFPDRQGFTKALNKLSMDDWGTGLGPADFGQKPSRVGHWAGDVTRLGLLICEVCVLGIPTWGPKTFSAKGPNSKYVQLHRPWGPYRNYPTLQW